MKQEQAQAARILKTMARMEPKYDMLSAEYGVAENWRGQLPEDFPEQALKLLRENPDTAEQVDQYVSLFNVLYPQYADSMESFGATDILTPELIVAVMVLLSVHFHIKRDKKGKWTFEAGFKPLNAQVLKPVVSVLAAVMGELGEGLVELSETLSGQTEIQQDT